MTTKQPTKQHRERPPKRPVSWGTPWEGVGRMSPIGDSKKASAECAPWRTNQTTTRVSE